MLTASDEDVALPVSDPEGACTELGGCSADGLETTPLDTPPEPLPTNEDEVPGIGKELDMPVGTISLLDPAPGPPGFVAVGLGGPTVTEGTIPVKVTEM